MRQGTVWVVWKKLAGSAGLEPALYCTKNRCITIMLRPISEGRNTLEAQTFQALKLQNLHQGTLFSSFTSSPENKGLSWT
jgi:hypothetical protein